MDREVSEYIVLRAHLIDDVVWLVNEHIAKGYQPLGGIAVGFGDDEVSCIAQAMVKYKPKNELS
jgi:hypothetical protein